MNHLGSGATLTPLRSVLAKYHGLIVVPDSGCLTVSIWYCTKYGTVAKRADAKLRVGIDKNRVDNRSVGVVVPKVKAMIRTNENGAHGRSFRFDYGG